MVFMLVFAIFHLKHLINNRRLRFECLSGRRTNHGCQGATEYSGSLKFFVTIIDSLTGSLVLSFSTWLALIAVCALGAMSPGPSLAVVIRQTVAGSRVRGVATGCAHAVGIGIYALLTSFGLAVLVTGSPAIYRLLALAGSGYLLWLGIGALRNGGDVIAPGDGVASRGVMAAARDGFAISLLNPKIAVFFLALFSQFVRPGMGAGTHALMSATAMVVDATWYALVAVVLSRAGMLGLLRRHGRWIDWATGTVLIALALVTLSQLVV